ncbi:hypothetical protein L7F22_016104 [Adiantum nelumboides]|nr:hypothetical protein [Adiantum nelumboides]
MQEVMVDEEVMADPFRHSPHHQHFLQGQHHWEWRIGTVYNTMLPDERAVAINKLEPAELQRNKEFLAEMETLGKVKHKNLVPLLGYCSFGNEKLLVYDYVAHESLDIWLRNMANAVEVLDWAKRFKIAIGAAQDFSEPWSSLLASDLDLSENHLEEPVPLNVCSLEVLRYLGKIPNTPVCKNGSFKGNLGLCARGFEGGCKGNVELSTSRLNTSAILGITTGSSIVVLCLMFVLVRWRSWMQEVMADEEVMANPFGHSPHHQQFLQGQHHWEWRIGTVYKAGLPDERIVAIKKLELAGLQGKREFLAEMETLGKVKHKNLIPLLGYCSFGNEKLLLYDYMAHESLDVWLRNKENGVKVLVWAKRFKIAIGAAQVLAFLHHGFISYIIYKDMKARNILLDTDFEPKVANFGLARLINVCKTYVSIDIAMTFGYIPLEYGQSWRSTIKGNVYSYGVILLELLTGKEPTRADFK